ncbi:MAG: hypothetical protein KGL39_00730 [Patescibacteria group bacterium]|nr:hypothetical protein [Patescibacteria group bacterium]
MPTEQDGKAPRYVDGDLVVHPCYGKCLVDQAEHGGELVIIDEREEYYRVRDKNLKLRSRGSVYVDPQEEFYQEIFQVRGKGNGWLKTPKKLLKTIDPELATFLCYLIDWRNSQVPRKLLDRNGGEFYCSTKALAELVPAWTRRVQERLFKRLYDMGFVSFRMVHHHKSRRTKQPYKNHRYLKIHFDRLAEAIKQANFNIRVHDDFSEDNYDD